MAVSDFLYDDDGGLIVEWSRSSGSTRLLTIQPGDVLGILYEGEPRSLKVERIEPVSTFESALIHGEFLLPGRGSGFWPVSLPAREVLQAWSGVWY